MTIRGGRIGTGSLVILSALAGLLVGGLALYVSGGLSGNRSIQGAAPEELACRQKTDAAKSVAAMAKGQVAAMLAADPPQSLRDLAFTGPQGEAMTLADLSGKTLLVNLWATWCAPCRAEMPALDALERSLGGEDFEVVAINLDTGSENKPRDFLEEIGVSALGFYRDETLGVFNELKRRSLALGLPATLLVDREGCLLAHMNGPADWASEDAVRLIEAARRT
jgi:thiol-disulfide isomerase/thioredoxin